jgi:UrcA family protein
MNIFKSRLIPAGALLAFTLLQAGVSLADPARESQHMAVNYADLNLSSRAGAEAMYRRLQAAAERVCPITGVAAHFDAIQQRSCMHRAIAEAVAQMNAPLVTQLHREKTGQREATVLAGK